MPKFRLLSLTRNTRVLDIYIHALFVSLLHDGETEQFVFFLFQRIYLVSILRWEIMDAYQERLDSGKVSKFYAQVGIKGFNVRSF